MKTLIVILSLALLSFIQPASQKVYVCNSSTSIAYHNKKDCKGLNNCKHEIVLATIEDAKKASKRPCKICYK